LHHALNHPGDHLLHRIWHWDLEEESAWLPSTKFEHLNRIMPRNFTGHLTDIRNCDFFDDLIGNRNFIWDFIWHFDGDLNFHCRVSQVLAENFRTGKPGTSTRW
jgi:hypothetical protein